MPCATANDEVVVNGMSLSRRDSPYANSGIVVGIEPEDTVPWQAEHGVLAGPALQREVEMLRQEGGGRRTGRACAAVGGLSWRKRESQNLPGTSYFPRGAFCPVGESSCPEFMGSSIAGGAA